MTGGSRGIGAAISRALAEAGPAVAINYRERTDEAKKLGEDLRKTGSHAASDGSGTDALTDYNGSDREVLTVGGEANKLAINDLIRTGTRSVDTATAADYLTDLEYENAGPLARALLFDRNPLGSSNVQVHPDCLRLGKVIDRRGTMFAAKA